VGIPRIEVETSTGSLVALRRGLPDDGALILAGFEHLGDESRFHRFFTAMPKLQENVLAQFLQLDGRDRVAVAAFDPKAPSEVGSDEGRGIGVARYLASAEDEQSAELAVTVIDDYHGLGVGRVLLEALVVGALHAGLTSLYGYVLRDNGAMIHVFRRLGGREQFTERPEPGVQRYAIDLAAAVTTFGPRRPRYATLFR
jgi:GNAT superfamily N-acetyltransferase